MAKHLFISLLFILGGSLEIIRFLPQSNFLSGIALLFEYVYHLSLFSSPSLSVCGAIVGKWFHTFLVIFLGIFIQLCKTRFQTIYAKNSSGRWSANTFYQLWKWFDGETLTLSFSLVLLWIESIRHSLCTYISGMHLHTFAYALISHLSLPLTDLLFKWKILLQPVFALKHRFGKRFFLFSPFMI